MDEEQKNRLHQLYSTASDPGSYGGVNRLYRRAKEVGLNVTKKDVTNYLKNIYAYSLHKPARKHFARNPTYVGCIDRQWQADLADMKDLSRKNNGYKYILTVIDCFSKYAWAIPIKDKTSKTVVDAFKELFRQSAPRVPLRLHTDKGLEFLNKDVKHYLTQKGVTMFQSNSDQKAAMVERFNRTLKERIFTKFTDENTANYIDSLQDIVKA